MDSRRWRLAAAAGAGGLAVNFDLLVRGGTVVDGSGITEPFAADVGVVGDRIEAIGDLSAASATSQIDATGRVVAPGFIDVHVHGEIALLGGRDQYAEVRQGITTQLLAPDGFGWARLAPQRARELWQYTLFAYGNVEVAPPWGSIAEYLALFDRTTPSNVVAQVPHCAVRAEVMGWQGRAASAEEVAAMVGLTREWMEAGARALNLGLDYQPSAHAAFEELVALCRVAAEYDGIYAAHQRYQLLGREAAWRETIALSRAAEIPVHVSHERVDDLTGPLLDQVQKDGVDLSFESYLYPAGMTHMTMMLPMEYQQGTPEEVLARLPDPKVRAASLPLLEKSLGRGDQICGFTRSGRYVGRRLAELAEAAGTSLAEFAYDLLIEEEGLQTFVFPWQVPAEEAAATLAATATHPLMMVASDGVYNIPHPHPRGTGCFAQVLGEFVRDRGQLSLAEAVYKMSGFPADRFRIHDRGRIATGRGADLVVFDPPSVAARSTYKEPMQLAAGIDDVVVNGQPVISGGAPTARLPGRVLGR
jgi:N-acyl-D-amino-acid deacylase